MGNLKMRRAVRLGLFIGTIIGMTACAAIPGSGGQSTSGAYGSIDVGRTY
jgi:hypothetical protein